MLIRLLANRDRIPGGEDAPMIYFHDESTEVTRFIIIISNYRYGLVRARDEAAESAATALLLRQQEQPRECTPPRPATRLPARQEQDHGHALHVIHVRRHTDPRVRALTNLASQNNHSSSQHLCGRLPESDAAWGRVRENLRWAHKWTTFGLT